MIPAGDVAGRGEHRIGRYRILRRIGKGGMGMVYRAVDDSLDREVAVKTLTETPGDDETRAEMQARFGIEARAAAKLQHPNIITVYEFGEDRGVSFIAMELLGGTDLESLLRSGEPLLLQEKLEIAIQVCRGLAFAHEHGMVHRDIKPANVRLLEDGIAKILDFGIAKVGGTGVTKTGVMIGTLNYMSPEQVRGEDIDGRSDVFSVGVMLYQLLSGKRPFEGQGTDVLYKIVHAPSPRLETDLGSAGPRLADIVARALAKEADDRFPSAAAFGDALESVLEWYTESAVPPVLEADQAVLADARRLLRERNPGECVELFASIVERNPHSVAARRALRAANRALERQQRGPEPVSGEFPELDATFLRAGQTQSPGETLRQPPTMQTRVLPLQSLWAGPGAWIVAAVAVVAGVAVWFLAPRSGSAPVPAPSPAVATPGPGTAAIEIPVRSEPPGAVVWRNGRNTGTVTPGTLRLSELPEEGSLELVFRKQGYQDAPESIPLPLDSDAGLDVRLSPIPQARSVMLVTRPPGAQVSVDGHSVAGTTPTRVALDPEADHVVEFRLAGHQTRRERLAPGALEEELTFGLSPIGPPGTVAVSSAYPVSVASGEAVLAQGEMSPRLELAPGRHTLTIRAPEVFLSRTVDVDVRGGETHPVTTPGLGKISIRANPGNCRVLIDGRFVDYPPILDQPIAEGPHTVTFEWADGGRQEKAVAVVSGKTAYAQGRK
jgi:serine/threonine protein kinase